MTVEPKLRNPLARRWLLNLALLAVVVALGLYAWYRSGETPPEETEATLTALAADTVQKIEIVHPREAPTRLVRSDSGWRLTAPFEARADAFAVDALLRVLQAPIESTLDGGDPARYGLDRPTLILRFDETEIRFGVMHPLEDEYYVQHGSAVHLISSRYYAQSAAPPANLIDSRLLEPGRKPVAFRLPGFGLTLTGGEWRRTPEIEMLSSDLINGFVDDWRHARALQVRKYAGGKVQERVIITFETPDGNKSDLTVGILAREPELVLYRPDEGLEYHFPQDTAERLLKLGEK